MLDHVGIGVTDFDRSRAFYETALAPLGLAVLIEPLPTLAGFGEEEKPFFWISARDRPTVRGVHIAFEAPDRSTVDAFHAPPE